MNEKLARVVKFLFLSTILSAGAYFFSVVILLVVAFNFDPSFLYLVSDFLLAIFTVTVILFIIMLTIYLFVTAIFQKSY